MDMEILSEDVKEFCRRAASLQEQGMTFVKANFTVLVEVLPNYEVFWQLVILGVIAQRTHYDTGADDNLLEYFLDNHPWGSDQINDYIQNEFVKSRSKGIGKMHKPHEDWSKTCQELRAIMAAKDKSAITS